MKLPPSPDLILPPHGGYRRLKSFQVAQLIYDLTVRFCGRFIPPSSRTHDQMVQAARSGVQNIAHASLEELRRDYEDFLRHHRLALWELHDPRLARLIALRPTTADDVAQWAESTKHCHPSIPSIVSISHAGAPTADALASTRSFAAASHAITGQE